ncbi:hypothetical protein RhiirA5_421459 [Rhizophagus irregularis]|uniref:F-box domain-containing protein n=1 Tax=Rhizophagus irregularis TaxID=588596 RepID=A0A2N0PDY2_9GLOM|nr:hypothetical protein RhiirA5_421459 [Rhizophagus irregularis]
MPHQLPADCLNEIFEYIEQDKNTLYSCLLVNRLWCEVAVRILWRNIWNFQYGLFYMPYQIRILMSIINTLISCLPKESKEHLYEKGIDFKNRKSSLFNYASFCRVLSIHGIDQMIQLILRKQHSITSNYHKKLLSQEILKMFMIQVSSLKSLDCYSGYSKDIIFDNFPGAKKCLNNLTEFNCSSDIDSKFFYQISRICHNIQTLKITFGNDTSNGLAELISSQKNLKNVILQNYYTTTNNGKKVLNTFKKFSSTLIKLKIRKSYMPLLFISDFNNLQELILSSDYYGGCNYFNQLQHVIFPKLKVLKFYTFLEVEKLIKFLEINGKNLKELYIRDENNSLNLAIAKFCPNLKTLFTKFIINEPETLKTILNNCQYLENINFWRGYRYLNEIEFLDILTNYSPKNFYRLEMYYVFNAQSKLFSKELENFFINWNIRNSKKLLSLIIIKDYESLSLEENDKNMKIIERYMNLGFIKNFKITRYENNHYLY